MARQARTEGNLGLRVGRRERRGPLPKAHFRVFVDGEEIGIQAITPLHWIEPDVVDPSIRQTVTLRRAAGTDQTLYRWRAAVAAGKPDERVVTIAQLDGAGGKPVNIWQLEKATAVRWTGPDLDARSPELAVEEIEIAYEKIAWRSSA